VRREERGESRKERGDRRYEQGTECIRKGYGKYTGKLYGRYTGGMREDTGGIREVYGKYTGGIRGGRRPCGVVGRATFLTSRTDYRWRFDSPLVRR